MNKQRRNKLQQIIISLEEVVTDEQNAYDNMPENLQESDIGEIIEEKLDKLNDAKELLEEVID